MRAWLTFAIAGLGTYLLRASFILAGPGLTLPPSVERALRYVAPAVFAAIVTPPVFGADGLGAAPDRVPELAATVVAGYIGWRTGRVIWVLAVGMVTLWLLRATGL